MIALPPLDVPVGHDDLEGVSPPMATLRLFGHTAPWAELTGAASNDRLHHAWLLQGSKGIGKATTAFAFARLLCGARPAPLVNGGMTSCSSTVEFNANDPVVRQIALGNYPGLIHVDRPAAERGGGFRTQITIEEIRRLNQFFQATSSAGWRIAVIDPADDMNRNAANALLKMLEEPPARSIFFIVSHSAGRLLPTIRSRCRLLRFEPLPEPEIAAALMTAIGGASPEEYGSVVEACSGSVRRAIMLLKNGGLEIHDAVNRLTKANRADWNSLHSLADQITMKGREAAFDLLIETILDAIACASEDLLVKGKGARAAEHAALWQEETRRMREANAYNLDRKQTLITLFDRYYRIKEPSGHSAI